MKKKTFKVIGMHCTSCALMIESDLDDIGVKATCSYAKQTLTVEFDQQSISEEHITRTVEKIGYRLTS